MNRRDFIRNAVIAAGGAAGAAVLGGAVLGAVKASGVWPVGAIRHTPFPEQAYRLGKSI